MIIFIAHAATLAHLSKNRHPNQSKIPPPIDPRPRHHHHRRVRTLHALLRGPPLRPTTRRPPRLILNPSPSPSKMLKRATKVIDLIWSPDSPPLLEEIKKSQVKMARSRKFRPLSRETHPAASYLQRACPRVTSPHSHCSNKLGSQTS